MKIFWKTKRTGVFRGEKIDYYYHYKGHLFTLKERKKLLLGD